MPLYIVYVGIRSLEKYIEIYRTEMIKSVEKLLITGVLLVQYQLLHRTIQKIFTTACTGGAN